MLENVECDTFLSEDLTPLIYLHLLLPLLMWQAQVKKKMADGVFLSLTPPLVHRRRAGL